MFAFDKLKYAVDNLREEYGDFTKLDSSDFASGRYEVFTMQEAVTLFEEQLQTIESALEDESLCIQYVPKTDMELIIRLLNEIKIYLDNKNHSQFTTRIEEMISPVRSFAMLSMKNYEEKLKENEKEHAERIERQNELIFSQKLVESLKKKEKRISGIWIEITWVSSALVVLAVASYLGWDIAKNYLNSDAMKIFMNVFFILIAFGVTDFTIRQYLITKRQNAAILAIKKTDEYESIQRLSVVLEEMEKESVIYG